MRFSENFMKFFSGKCTCGAVKASCAIWRHRGSHMRRMHETPDLHAHVSVHASAHVRSRQTIGLSCMEHKSNLTFYLFGEFTCGWEHVSTCIRGRIILLHSFLHHPSFTYIYLRGRKVLAIIYYKNSITKWWMIISVELRVKEKPYHPDLFLSIYKHYINTLYNTFVCLGVAQMSQRL